MIDRRRALVPVLATGLSAALAAQTHEALRGVLQSPGGELPFVMTAILGPHRICHGGHEVPVAWRPDGARPPYFIDFPPYDSWIEHGEMQDPMTVTGAYVGHWSKVGPAGTATMPFRWEYWPTSPDQEDPTARVRSPLFSVPGEPWDVTGRWRVQFEDDAHPAIAVFEPSRSRWSSGPGEIQGTFLTVTGDYRYLAGTARGDEVRLSCFDGAHAFLFAARRMEDGSLAGDFWSGTSWHEAWVAHRDDGAGLPDAFTLTKARANARIAELRYPDVLGEAGERRVGDLLGRCTLVVLFGTWCPNCNDAGPFLQDLVRRHGDRGLRVVGLAFEHGDDRERHRRVVADYRERHAITWPLLLAGPSDKQRASAAFPVLDAVRSYPTTLFVDADGEIRSVHQGFAGPATGAAHTAQRAAFERIVVRLLDEAGAVPVRR